MNSCFCKHTHSHKLCTPLYIDTVMYKHTPSHTHTHTHTHTHSIAAGCRGSIRFFLNRIHMRTMHYAVEKLNLDTIFPTSSDSSLGNHRSAAVLNCLKELKRSELNKSQQEAVTSMLDPACTKVHT